jgi:rhodanese-related sulfurtransferase
MKLSFFVLFLQLALSNSLHAQTPYLENKKLQMTPATLNMRITQNKDVPVILNIGTEGKIKGSLQVGIMTERKDSDLLQKVKGVSKSKEIVIYCGCCTLENCENVEKAFNILKKSGYSNVKTLNLGEGYGPGWSGKGYPVEK